MKVLVVRQGVLYGGGIIRVIESWCRVLLSLGHDVTVVSQAPAAGAPSLRLPGVRHLEYAAPQSRTRVGKFAAARTDLLLLIGAHRNEVGVDLIICHDSFFSVEISRSFSAIPLIGTFHSPLVDENRLQNWKYAPSLYRRITYPLTFLRSWSVDRRALTSIDCAHTLSEYTWGLLSSRYPTVCASRPWAKVQGCFDPSRFVPPRSRKAVRRDLGLADSEVVLLTVRRLVPRNGVERILHAARRLASSSVSVRFLIGGRGPEKDQLERKIVEMDLSNHVAMLGFIPERTLPLYYQAADAFLMPTRDLECFGLPVIEAMACGCPPLVMPHGGPAEICRDYPSNVAAKNTAGAFADLVESFVGGEVETNSDRMREMARETYSENAIRPAVEKLLNRTLDGKRP